MVYIHTDIQREETSGFVLSRSVHLGMLSGQNKSLQIKVLKCVYSIPSSWISGASTFLILACHICRSSRWALTGVLYSVHLCVYRSTGRLPDPARTSASSAPCSDHNKAHRQHHDLFCLCFSFVFSFGLYPCLSGVFFLSVLWPPSLTYTHMSCVL